MMHVGLRYAALAVAVAAMIGGAANANLTWYDGFVIDAVDDGLGPNYVAGALGGQIGGAGSFFDGLQGWEQASEQILLPDSLHKNAQIDPSVGGSVGDNECCGRNSRIFASPWGGFTDPEETFYVGFLANFGTIGEDAPGVPAAPGNVHHRVFEMHNGPNTTAGDAARVLMFGYSSFALPPFDGNNPASGYMKLGIQGGATADIDIDTVTPGLQPLELVNDGMTHCIVLKFEMHVDDGDPMTTADNDIISVYVDPMGLTEPAVPNAQVVAENFFADRMSAIANFQFNGGVLPVFDELRVADNSDGHGFRDVACMRVPEPATLSLFGMAMFGLMTLARRRRA